MQLKSPWFAVLSFAAIAAMALLASARPQAAEPAPAAEALTQAGINARLDVSASTVQNLVFQAGDNHRLTTAVEIDGRLVTLELRRHSLRAATFQVLVQDQPGGPLIPVEAPEVTTYRGSIPEIPGSEVRGSYVNGGLTAVIYTPQGSYGVQPMSELGIPGAGHVVYLEDHAIGSDDYRCGTTGDPVKFEGQAAAERSTAGTGDEICELGLDADYDFFLLNGGTVANTVQDMENVINGVEPLYEVSPLDVTYEITTMIVRTVPGAPYTTTSPGGLLDQFQNTWNTSPESDIQRDVAHLFTGKNLNGTTIGIATLGVVCSGFNGYGLSQSRYTSNFTLRRSLTAHELGHNWNAGHCDGASPCRIMCSGNGGCSGLNPLEFGPSEVAQLNPFIESRACLTNQADTQVLPFCEDWPSSIIDPAKWSYVNGGFPSQTAVGEPSDPWSLNLDAGGSGLYSDDEIRTNFIDLTGQSFVDLSYRTQHRGVEAGEQLVVEYWRNTRAWVELNRLTSNGTDQNTFVFHLHTLPADAMHNEFRVRFRAEVDSSSDDWFIDDISLNCEALGCEDPCDDHNACTLNDACGENICEGEPVDCSPFNQDCRMALCNPGGTPGNCSLLVPFNEGGSCNSGLGVCQEGECIETRLFLTGPGQEQSTVPTGSTALTMFAGQSATVEVWVARTTPQQLGAYQVALPGAATPSGGSTGTVTYLNNAGTGSMLIDKTDPDWVFSIDPSIEPFYSETGLPQGFAMLIALPLGNGVEVTDMAYLGEFQLQASPDAEGTFTLDFLPLNAPPNGGCALADQTGVTEVESLLQQLTITVEPFSGDCLDASDCADLDLDTVRDDACVWWDCDGGACLGEDIIFADMGGAFGSCPPDDFVNLFDRNQALTCFAATSLCDPINIDAGGAFGSCEPDGFCNLFDANHAITAFAGTNPCSCPAGAAPQSAPLTEGSAVLSAVAERKTMRPGDTIAVDLFIEGPLPNLQSYQLDVTAEGGRRGQLELVSIDVEPGLPHVFGGEQGFEAFNIAAGRMLAGLEHEGVATPKRGYLATFLFRASVDAAGTFVVDLRHDEPAGDQTFLVSGFTRRITVQETRPAVITVHHAERSAK